MDKIEWQKQYKNFWLYPLIISISILCFFYFSDEFSIALATLYSSIIGGLLIMASEFVFPFRKDWRGFHSDSINDLQHMILTQNLIPKLIEALWISTVVYSVSEHQLFFWQSLNSLPIAAQFFILLFVGEFAKYWIHRWCHTYHFLWRLHAIHHSVKRIYFFNVGRFHPIEKVIQMFSEILLFLVLGVPEQTIGLYLVFYSVNGFFQHSNINLNLGVFNYFINSVEQHRFHHSKLIHESNTNYGNKLSIFDLMFNSFYLPNTNGPSEYGLINPNYPEGFWSQLVAPFYSKLDKQGNFLDQWPWTKIIRNLIGKRVLAQGQRIEREWQEAAINLETTQWQTLAKIIKQNEDTAFGRKYNFNSIHSIRDYLNAVPFQTYEKLEPFIQEQISQKTAALTAETPTFYALTSGTTAVPKLIPVTPSSSKTFKKLQNLWLYELYKQEPETFSGKYFAIVGSADERTTENGTACGSTSGQVYATLPKLLQSIYVIPPFVFEIANNELKYLTIIRIAINHDDISFISSVNPSSLNLLIDYMEKNKDSLYRDLIEGSFSRMKELPENIQAFCQKLFQPNQERADQFLKFCESKFDFKYLWPKIKTIACWQGGSCQVAFQKLKQRAGVDILYREIGYLSSEVRASVPLNRDLLGELPSFMEHFFEFVEVEQWNSNVHDFKLLHEIEVSKKYYIFVTTQSGLYRYFMNDIIEVMQKYKSVPLIRFVQKGRGVTSITGEKLYEQQFLKSIEYCWTALNLPPSESLALADVENAQYDILIEVDKLPAEKFSRLLDEQLMKNNIEYESKRKSGRLKPPQIHIVNKGFFSDYRAYLVQNGQRDVQLKVMYLQYKNDFHFKWDNLIKAA